MELLSAFIGGAGVVIAIVTWWISSQKQNQIKFELEGIKKQNDELKKERPKKLLHNIIMDGMTASGKTTFIARIINPSATKEDLQKIAATTKNYTTIGIPICWEKKTDEKYTKLHSLRFHDISGEKGSTFINALTKINTNLEDQSEIVKGSILLVIWDISEDKVTLNSKHLNKDRIEMGYGNDIARETIKSVIVFFNKTDLFSNQRSCKDIINAETDKIKKIFEELFDKGYEDIKFYSGSALEGTGIHNCYGEILRSQKLEHNFEPITGNPHENRE